MNKQFTLINKRFQETNERIHLERSSILNVISSAFAANLMISDIRRVQQSLLDLVTDVKGGRVDAHLLKPDQLQEQLNIISGQLPSELSLPCTNSHQCIRQMYKLSRVHVKLTRDFFLFEVKLPLVNNEQYEISRVIPIPSIQGQIQKHIITTSEYLALNLKKDVMMPLTYDDLRTCIQLRKHRLLCELSLPVYDIKQSTTTCEALIIVNNKDLSACHTTVSSCRDKWIQLHNDGAWLYTCCKNSLTRIFCPSGTSSKQLSGTGIISLGPGCMLKGDNIILRSHYNFHSEITVKEDEFYLRESTVNHFIADNNYTFQPEHHEEMMKTLEARIQQVKLHQETLNEVTTSHDTHRYILYSFMLIVVVGVGLWIIFKLKKHYGAVLRVTTDNPDREQATNEPRPRTSRDTCMANKVDRATSPTSWS
ncbi:hypothetical protein B5X24_HaOG212145 [Helicoverpa armigera]|nr:hypothetical protein B5X24_HaOG212145 [Helicoverpa armigera]